MKITIIEYGGTPRQIECEAFEFRCNHVTNWIKIKKANSTDEMIKDICVIKLESEE